MMKRKHDSQCYGCGKCCYNVPLPKSLLTSLKNRIVNEFNEVMELDSGLSEKIKTVYAFTKDMKCPFLKQNNTCNIYDRRPKICREFGISDNKLLQCSILYGREDKKLSPAEAANILISSVTGKGGNMMNEIFKLLK